MSNTNPTLAKTLLNLLATNTLQDEFSSLVSEHSGVKNPAADHMREALRRKKDADAAAAADAAAVEVLDLIKESDRSINTQRTKIAEARRAAAFHKTNVERIAVARMYGERTMNWLPLALAMERITILQITLEGRNVEEFTIPAETYKELLEEVKQAQLPKPPASQKPAAAKSAVANTAKANRTVRDRAAKRATGTGC